MTTENLIVNEVSIIGKKFNEKSHFPLKQICEILKINYLNEIIYIEKNSTITKGVNWNLQYKTEDNIYISIQFYFDWILNNKNKNGEVINAKMEIYETLYEHFKKRGFDIIKSN